jgi:hypothetical protein
VRLLPVAGAIVSAAIAGGPVHADGVGVIAAGDDRAAVAAAMIEAIRASGPPGRLVADAVGEARAARAAGAVPAAALAEFRRVRAMIDDGWRAFVRVQIDAAQSQLAAARRDAEALAALPAGAELCADAALRLGAVLLYRNLPEAPASLALALALDPDRPITLAEFSPDVVNAVAAVRAAPAALQRVHIATRPAGAIVSVDGTELGAAPLDAQLVRGQHVVVARAPLHHPAVRGVVVGGPASPMAPVSPASVDLALDPDDIAVRLAAGAEPGLAAPAEQALIDAAVTFADLDEAVVAAMTDRRGGPTLIVQRCGGVPARCTTVAEIGFGSRAGLAAAAREAWQAVKGGALREPPSAIDDIRRPPPSSGCRLCRNPWVWAGAGAAVVTAVIVIAATSGSRPPPIVTINGNGFGH